MLILFRALAALLVAWLLAGAGFLHAQDRTAGGQVTAQAYRSINVRSGPDVGFEAIDRLDPGRVVPVTGRSDAYGNWLRIELDGRDGWVAFFTVAVRGDVTALPIVADGEERDLAPLDLFVAPVPLGSAPRSTTASPIRATAFRRVNVRSGPGTEFPVLTVLPPGETVPIVGTIGGDHAWIQIDYGGQRGWIAYFVVSVSGDLRALEVVPPTIPGAEATAGSAIEHNQVVVITRFNTNLRAEPRFGAAVLRVVPYETTLQAEARSEDGEWIRVTHDGETGWLIGTLLNTGASDVMTLPVEDESPSPAATAALPA